MEAARAAPLGPAAVDYTSFSNPNFVSGNASRANRNSSLAEEGQVVARKILNTRENDKSQKTDRRVICKIEAVDEVLEVIKKRLPEERGLEQIIVEMTQNCKLLKEHLDSRRLKYLKLVGQMVRVKVKDTDLENIMRKLDNAMQNLKMDCDVQFAMFMSALEKNGAVTAKRYSNADLREFFEGGAGEGKPKEWRPKQTNIYLSQQSTSAEAILRNAYDDEVRINYVQTQNFQSAFTELKGCLHSFSYPINDVFSLDSLTASDTNEGEIKLKTTDSSLYPIILWVFYNTFIRMELFPSKKSSSTQFARNSFHELAEYLQHNIKTDSVQAREEARLPRIGEIQPSKPVMVGNPFFIDVDADTQDFHEASCQSDVSCITSMIFQAGITKTRRQKIVYSTCKDNEKGYRYTFLATQAGVATIYFYFAHHRTLTFASKCLEVTIEPAAKPLSDLPEIPFMR
ncbi:MAG: hypothetical protein M1821_008409 [Bathelium mastoideum]|nr:MAG: hypothetical protein M1821_008409 [Bathelium mastoideum]